MTLFEVESGKPYHELEKVIEPAELFSKAEELSLAREYPDMEMLVLCHAIKLCWDRDYAS
ncbi:hypothetical protein BBP40_001180 [Aspergillus hancockii]|nr:hypothetical protein BBP40_001180 [Aspergillus hancockii]